MPQWLDPDQESRIELTERSDELVERLGRLSDANGGQSLWWRPSLGQATFDLLAAGIPVTIEALIERLEASAKPEDLVHRKRSAKSAIDVLRTLVDQQTGT